MKTKNILSIALVFLSVTAQAGVTIRKWNFSSHTWRYVGEYRCNDLGEVKLFSNSEINRWRVAHYNGHQDYPNQTKLWVKNPDGQYVAAYALESQAKGSLYFQNSASMQNFLANLTS